MAPAVFTTLKAPRLYKLGRVALQKFADERAAYETAIGEAREQSGDDHIQAESLKTAIDPELLWSLVDLFEFGPEIDDVSAVTEEHISQLLAKYQEPAERISLRQLTREAGALKMDVQEPDAEQRVVKLFSDYTRLLRRRQYRDLVKRDPAMCIGHILPLLRPPALQARARRDLEYDAKEMEKNFHEFYQYLVQQAALCDQFVSAESSSAGAALNSQDARRETPSRQRPFSGNRGMVDSSEMRFPRTEGVRPRPQSTGAGPSRPPSQRPQVQQQETSTSRGSRSFSLVCLNSTCLGKHSITDCPKTSESLRKRLLSRYRDIRQELIDRGNLSRADAAQQAAQEVRSRGIPTGQSNGAKMVQTPPTEEPPNHLIKALLGGVVKGKAMLDNGSDDNTISHNVLDALVAKKATIEQMPLSHSLRMNLTSAEHQVDVVSRVRATIELELRSGPLRLRNVCFLVLAAQYDEFILGRPLLREIGLNVEEQLGERRKSIHDKSFDHVPGLGDKSVGQLSALLLARNGPGEGAPDTDPFEPDVPFIPFGKDTDADLANEIDGLLKRANEEGASAQTSRQLSQLCQSDAKRIFALRLSTQPPAKFEPMKIELIPGHEPVRHRPRPMSEEKRQFVQAQTNGMVKYGLAYRNPSSTWAHPVHVVPKPGPARFRFTVDTRGGNARQKNVVWPMPHLESVVQGLTGRSYFATFDLSQGYWQLPLAGDSQECQSFVTHEGVFTPTRVLHGNSNSVAYLQSCLTKMTETISEYVTIWLDDVLISAKSENQLLNVLKQFFSLCKQHNLLLSPKKSSLFLREVRYCGRLISAEGVRMDPRNHEALLTMAVPTTGAELQQYCCALNWMRSALPNFAATVAPLNALLESVYTSAKGRTKRKAATVHLKGGEVDWTCEHQNAFDRSREALQSAVTLAHRDHTQRLCVFTDASDSHWASVVTQIPLEDLNCGSLEEQRHSPLAFLSGSFKGSTLKWSITDKEAYPIVATVLRLDYLLQTSQGYTLFCDHRNLVYIFDPIKHRPGLLAHSAARLQRWAMILSASPYTIEHVPGEKNIWADLLTRWGAPKPQIARACGATKLSPMSVDVRRTGHMLAPIRVDWDSLFPSLDHILDEQIEFKANMPEGVRASKHRPHRYPDTGTKQMGPLWIPAQAVRLQLRLSIIAHCGSAGHRGRDATLRTLSAFCRWDTMAADIANFCRTCLHCVATVGGDRIPRPFGQALHANEPRSILHFDYLYVGPSAQGFKYILIFKDDFSGFVWLFAHQTCDAIATATSMIELFAAFGVWRTWVSDQGSHFKNQVIEKVRSILRAQHHFTVAYSPWANGTVERVCREVLRALRALCSEQRLPFKEWPALLPTVQSILNGSPSSRLGNNSPLSVLTGLSPTPPVSALALSDGTMTTLEPSEIRARQLMQVDRIQPALDEIHKAVATRQPSKQNSLKSALPDFSVGDFVLVGRLQSQKVSKLQVRWYGPRRVIAVRNPWVCLVEDLSTGEEHEVHITRLKFYHDASLDVTEDLRAFSAEANRSYEVEKLLNLRFNPVDKTFETLVSWRGFSADENTWEPLSNIASDLPHLTSKFLDSFPDASLADKARQILE